MAQKQLANHYPATNHIWRGGFTFQWRAILLLFLLLQGLCGSIAVTTPTGNNTLPSPQTPPYRSYSYPHGGEMGMDNCATFSDNSVTFVSTVASDLNEDQWYATIRTIYPNNTIINSTLLWMNSTMVVQNSIRLSNGNILLLYSYAYDRYSTRLFAGILTLNGTVVKNPITFHIWGFPWINLNGLFTPQNTMCASSVSTNGFLCSGLSGPDLNTTFVWAYYDNDGNMHLSGLQSLPSSFSSYITNTSRCTSSYVAPTNDGGFLLSWSFQSVNGTLPGSLYSTIFATFINAGTSVFRMSPLLIYGATSLDGTASISSCTALQLGDGFSCIMSLASAQFPAYFQVQFLSSGTILNIEMFSIFGVVDFASLYYGGSVITLIA
ncbi:hypothetical protein BC937DRAFT_93509 [Endogone sp. FLAS-F59071]|nr:hypothetical protein BC937DRAFT_93509 [Endogone sp. FLAS-F59071]|eukprot:RUS21144.1 hypothetical protein BC937DRAFT_93509 [Endogone sp. FLAS-F59071]